MYEMFRKIFVKLLFLEMFSFISCQIIIFLFAKVKKKFHFGYQLEETIVEVCWELNNFFIEEHSFSFRNVRLFEDILTFGSLHISSFTKCQTQLYKELPKDSVRSNILSFYISKS